VHAVDFTELLTLQQLHCNANRSIREGVSGRYSLIPPIEITVIAFISKDPSFLALYGLMSTEIISVE